MLVVSRFQGEEVFIDLPDGTRITVMVVDVRGSKVRIGFDAPKEIGIYRRELMECDVKKEGRS